MRRLLRRRSTPQYTSAPGRILAADRTVDGRMLSDDERDPAPLVASLDEPATHHCEGPGVARFRGWVVARSGAVGRVEIAADGVAPREQVADLPRADVDDTLRDVYEQIPLECGFDFRIEVPPGADSTTVRLRFTDGEYVVEVAPYTIARSKEPGRARSDYKGVWNSVSTDVDEAKTAVAGYTDEQVFREMADVTVQTLEHTVGLGPDDVVLEIGAGVGRVGPAIAPKVKRWIATDVSENMLGFARERCAGLDNVDFVPISGWDLGPIDAESVDVVYCTVVFMHLDEWERWSYVKEAMRVLRPGGRLYVDNFNLAGDDGWKFFLHTAENYHPLERPPNISKSSTMDEIRVYFERAGFESIVVDSNSMYVWGHGRKP